MLKISGIVENCAEGLAAIRRSLKSKSMDTEGTHFDGSYPHVFVTFGASGDLAKKKIYPTLWWLFRDNLLPVKTVFFGYARSSMTIEQLKVKCQQYMNVKPGEEKRLEEFWSNNYYVAGSYDKRRDFELLNQEISKFETNNSCANRLFYLALPPSVFMDVTVHIRESLMGLK